MAELNPSNSGSEDDDFCRISDAGEADLEEEQEPQGTKEAGTKTEVSEYCQVVFQNVAESYKPGKPLECYYVISPVLTPSKNDYVAVFKVGWTSTRSYTTFEYAPYPSNWEPSKEFKQCLIFNNYYLPREEDGEFYQFCYIDSGGNMRGASMPFQFLATSMDDFMEVADESLDILMIQSRKSHNSQLVIQLTEEKENLLQEKAQIEKEKNQLVGKVEELEAVISVKEEEFIEKSEVFSKELTMKTKEVSRFAGEKERYEESLAQTTDAFLEVQRNITQLEDERNRLKEDLEDNNKERDEFKGQFASSEKDNETLRTEIDTLKHQLMEANEQNQVVLAKEGQLKEEKQKIEQQLLVASSDQDHVASLKAQIGELENELLKSEEETKKLKEQLEALTDFHLKLTKDYEKATIDCDSLKMKLTRQGDDFLQKQKKTEQHMALVKHEASEKQILLQEQVIALKDGIQRLAKEKENLLQGTMGSEEASHIAVQSFKNRLTKSTRKADDEAQKRLQLQKELVKTQESCALEREDYDKQLLYYKKRLDDAEENAKQKASDSEKEISSLKVRLEMAKEEYKMLYNELRDVEKKGVKTSNAEVPTKEVVEVPVTKEVETVQTAPPPEEVEPSESYDARDMTLNMEEMNRQLTQLTEELTKRKERVNHYQTLYEKERIRRKEAENVYQEIQETKRQNEEEMKKKYRLKQDEIISWRDKFNKLHDDYMKTKHAFESMKYDQELTKSPSKKPSRQSPPRHTTPRQDYPENIIPRPPPPLRYGNPYQNGNDESLKVMSPPGKFKNPYEKGMATANLSGFQSLDTRSRLNNLPEPMQPQKTPQAKFMAMKATLADKPDGDKTKPSAPPMGLEEEREEDIYGPGTDQTGTVELPTHVESDGVRTDEGRPPSPSEYHDAPEYPATGQTCPKCKINFPHIITDHDLATHVQSHYAYHCRECDALLDKETVTEDEFRKHVQAHVSDVDLPYFCPVCSEVYRDNSPEQVAQHVNTHFTN